MSQYLVETLQANDCGTCYPFLVPACGPVSISQLLSEHRGGFGAVLNKLLLTILIHFCSPEQLTWEVFLEVELLDVSAYP